MAFRQLCVAPAGAPPFTRVFHRASGIILDGYCRRQLRISAIVDAHFRLIVDGETVSPRRRWGSAQELV